jgi:competence protein ComEC
VRRAGRARAAVAAALAHPRHLVLGALAAGLLTGPAPRLVALAVATVVIAAAASLRRPALGLILGVAVLAGALGAHARLAVLDRSALPPWLGRSVTLRAVILEAPRERPFGGWTAPMRITAGPGRGERVVLRAPAGARSRPRIGREVVARGRLEPLARWEGHERLRGAHAAIEASAVAATGRRRGGVAGAIDRTRDAAEHGVSTGLPPPQAALARGMVLGQDDALDADTRDAFRASGLAHLLAASGQNVALLALLAVAVLGLAGVGLRGRLAGALALIALYVPLAGAGPSIQRAGVMGAATLAAGLAGRPASRAYALLLAAVATLALNPRASADPGWQLSFAAVLAIAVVAPRVRDSLDRRGVPRPVAEAVAITVAATLGTAPLMGLHFEQVSLAALPANVVAAPAVAPVVWLGTVAAALAQAGPVVDPALRLLNAVAALPLGFVGLVADAASRAPGATVPVALGVSGVVAAYAGLGAAVASRRARLLAAGAAGALAIGVLARATSATGPPPRDPTVSFLDVGQGDATLLQDGSAAVLVDTGPPDGPILDRLREAGVRRLDLLVLTHPQSDHEGAAARVLRALPVGAVLDGGSVALGSVRRVAPAAGEVLRVGRLELRVLWPPAATASAPAPAGGDPNDRAVVLDVRDGGLEVLLTADAESPITLPLDLPAVDVLKVAHHGSADPGLPALLERLRPQIAVIEVGRANPYGHPDPGTMRALQRAVAHVLRTDRDGTVRVREQAGALIVKAAR